jgi:type IV pilus assembly protein PilE
LAAVRRARAPGFSLIELLIAVAIVGVLAAIAYPGYKELVREARRAEARAVLVQAAQSMERYYTEHGRFNQEDGTAPDPLPFPTKSPIDGDDRYYDISLATGGADALTATSFLLRAAPAGAQAEDECGTLTYDHFGRKGADSDGCW